MAYYDRYKFFRKDGFVEPCVPFIRILENDTDITIVFNTFTMRMDTLSYKYYGDSNYGWLILEANPSLPSYEYQILDGTRVRIPYPLDSALSRYESGVREYFNKQTNQ